MVSKTKSQTSSRLGSRLRGKLASAYSGRGTHQSKLWYVYSPKTGRDWVLRGNLEWGHFLLVEADLDIRDVDYSPASEIVRVGDDDHATTLDAVVTFRNGAIEWREIKWSDETKGCDTRTLHQWEAQVEAASRSGARYVRYSEKEIYACPQLIANWTRVVAWLAAVRGRSLYSESLEIVAMLDAHGIVSIGDIQLFGAAESGACRVAAALKGIQDGHFNADLRNAPLSINTLISRAEVAG